MKTRVKSVISLIPIVLINSERVNKFETTLPSNLV